MTKTIVRRGIAVTLGITLASLLPSTAAFAKNAPHDGTKIANRSISDNTRNGFATLADTVLTHRTSVLLDGTKATRSASTALPLTGAVSVTGRLARGEDLAAATLRERKARLASLQEAYTAADTEVSVDELSVTGDRATAEVTETTMLTYKKIRGDEPPTTGFQARHEMAFTAGADGTWQLTEIKPLDEGGPSAVNAVRTGSTESVGAPAPADPAGDPADTGGAPEVDGPAPAEQPSEVVKPAQPQGKFSAAAGYNYPAMAQYAERYWRNYNSSYRTFNDVGGDCTNFISQALRAGGWKNNTGWYRSYKNWWYNSANQTTSWVNVNYWASFALHSGRAYNLSNVYYMGVGDILQMDFSNNGSKDHSMITSYVSGGVPYLTYHSTNTYRKSVASIVASNPRATYYAFRT
ncbi:amidase domain-containing protein [Streptomyces albipurpureus]|uniref:Amidase domain-containing protein n=1 Tax=Streptomyces albipurpureus TaxID=2897419 RepID=A0ABT0UGV2_9ACTN|nr:amidase domain-containing protein [Streptomyces sp. CWNU-1]MCM2387264.1 amidase domain-containing protein [Streptomyces sp. CWNU-1]